MTRSVPRDCAAMRARIEAYIDGELDAVECAAIDRHCADCPECAGIVSGLRRTVGLCRDAGHAPLPRAISERARAHVKRLLADSRIPPEH